MVWKFGQNLLCFSRICRILSNYFRFISDSLVLSLILSDALRSFQNLIRFSYLFSYSLGISGIIFGFTQILWNLTDFTGFFRILSDFREFFGIPLNSFAFLSDSISFSKNHADSFKLLRILLKSPILSNSLRSFWILSDCFFVLSCSSVYFRIIS